MFKVIKFPAPVELSSGSKITLQAIMREFLLRDSKWGKTLDSVELRRSVRKKLELANGEIKLTIAEWEILDDVARRPTVPYNPEVADEAIDLIHAVITAETRSE